MPASRSVVSVLLRSWETFLYTLKAGPAGGRLRRPSSAGSPTRAARPDHNRLHQARVMPTAVAQTARESRPTV
jgi:hypothetical protein